MTDSPLPLPMDARRKARALYWMAWPLAEIARTLGENEKTVHSWKARDGWDQADTVERIGGALEMRLAALILKADKTGGDFKEIDLLHRQLERQARIQRYQGGGTETDLNPNLEKRNDKPKKQPRKNAFSEEEVNELSKRFVDECFDYQHDWYQARQQRTRVILKSRQIGATFYFAREALIDALTTARNQIFLSASKSQAFLFRGYMQSFVREVLDKNLVGSDSIKLDNGAELFFLGTNARTAQGYHGNFYFDEFFWTHRFEELNKVASGMAMHKKWRKTYFSTPSSMAHEAYPFWTGSRFNRGKPKAQHIEIDITHAALGQGQLGADKVWRQIVTIMDAARRGCDLFDIDELRMEYSAEAFSNLLMCEFVDDSLSVFPLSLLQPCRVDSWVDWLDVKPFTMRPYADKPVWLGYDPAETGDSAGLVVIAPPDTPGGVFRVLERHQFRGQDFAAQAQQIQAMMQRYWVTYIGIDTTGMGTGVAQIVKTFFPGVTTFQYSPEVKTRLVLKAYDVIKAGRLQFDAGWTDLMQSLMAIKKTLTPSGRSLTYSAGRREDTGHADLAWALFHALYNEPLERPHTNTSTSRLEIFE